MDIKYLGHSSFFIRSRDAKIVTDPFSPQNVGIKYPKTEADIVTISHFHDDHNYREGIKGEALFIDWPGEFEKNKVRVFGYQTYHDKKQGAERGENTMFKFESEGLSILHCGDLGHVLDDSLIEDIGNVDILLIPTGGLYSLTAQEAAKVVNEIEPSLVIPMHYLQPGMNEQIFAGLQPVGDFLKEIGAADTQAVEKLTIKKEDLNPEDLKVVVMSISV
ncbi:MBL fold metallo-hydrolase [soil metagenome]